VLLLYLVLTAVLVASAFGLQRSRDIGSGLLQARPGPSVGSPRLRGVGAITFRMNAVTLTIWSVATGAMSVALGAIAPNISNVLHSSGARGMIERIGGVGTLRETLLAAELSITAVIVTCFGLSVVGHTASDERDGRTAQVLASPTSRTSNFAATTAVALLGTGWLMLVAGSCLSLGYWSADGGSLNLIAAALVHLPAVWLVIALGILAWSFDNSFVVVGWGFLALFLTLGQLGELLQLPAWIIGISPYTHVPLIPVESFNAASTVTLSALAAVALALASTQYARRDIL
jgi:ABC-2 type transport system permease protein